MIVSKRKPVEEVLAMLQGVKRVAISGCHECALACKVGGDDECAEWTQILESKGYEVTGIAMPTESCLNFHVRKAAKELQKGKPEAVLSLACGSGIQTLAAQMKGIPVYPGSNTQFIGQVERVGRFNEMCRMCGDCVLGHTGAICPITKCAKSLVNGPCGGAKNGKCEVNPENDCAWIMIYNRLKDLGQLDKLTESLEDKDYDGRSWPRTVDLSKEGY